MRPRPALVVLGRPRSAFHVFGLVGLAASIVVCAWVLAERDVSPWALPLIAGTGVATFLALALAVKVVTGRESLIYYHHEILVLAACAIAVRVAGLPVLASLDAAVLGIGAFLTFGRVGCLNAGCCYGRPARHGVRYGPEHAAAGFPAELVGVRLVPVQAVEAAVAAAITVAGVVVVAAGAEPGVALVVYVAAYGVARFALEEWRGDAGRRRWLGFSEAQWTSLALTSLAVVSHWQAAIAAAAIVVAMVVLAWRAPRRPDAAHVTAIARALLRLDDSAGPVAVDGGLRLSGGTVDGHRHYALSGASAERLREAAGTVVALRHPDADAQIVERRGGVLHVLVEDQSLTSAERAVPVAWSQ